MRQHNDSKRGGKSKWLPCFYGRRQCLLLILVAVTVALLFAGSGVVFWMGAERGGVGIEVETQHWVQKLVGAKPTTDAFPPNQKQPPGAIVIDNSAPSPLSVEQGNKRSLGSDCSIAEVRALCSAALWLYGPRDTSTGSPAHTESGPSGPSESSGLRADDVEALFSLCGNHTAHRPSGTSVSANPLCQSLKQIRQVLDRIAIRDAADSALRLPYRYPVHESFPFTKRAEAVIRTLQTFFFEEAGVAGNSGGGSSSITSTSSKRSRVVLPQCLASSVRHGSVLAVDDYEDRAQQSCDTSLVAPLSRRYVMDKELNSKLEKEYDFANRWAPPTSSSASAASPDTPPVFYLSALDSAPRAKGPVQWVTATIPGGEATSTAARVKEEGTHTHDESSSHPHDIAEGDSDEDTYDDDDDGNLPCTHHVQRRLWTLQHPVSCSISQKGVASDFGTGLKKSRDRGLSESCPISEKSKRTRKEENKSPSPTRYLVSPLKEGSHGIGSALTLIAHDLLSSIVLGRVLLIHAKGRWYFAGAACGSDRHWSCFWQFPSQCQDSSLRRDGPDVLHGAVKIGSKREALLKHALPSIQKKTFDAPGLGRNDVPTDEEFFGAPFVHRRPKCYRRYLAWVADASHSHLQGTFAKAADPRLFYMLSQSLRYLLRRPQPWFAAMIRDGLQRVHMHQHEASPASPSTESSSDSVSNQQLSRVLYVQERGEIAKFREYYNTFGCHNLRSELLVDLARVYCGVNTSDSTLHSSDVRCTVFISGNTPRDRHDFLRDSLRGPLSPGSSPIHVESTWQLFESSPANQGTARWGASSPSASWIDLYAAVSAHSWACIVQSNWCRLVALLRHTAGRSGCPFVDTGTLVLASNALRLRYCIVNNSWPTKAFSNRLK